MEEEELYKKISELKGEYDLLCVGELLIDLISKEERPLADITDFEQFFGGSPANIVFHMSHLTKKPVIVTKIGKDKEGDFLMKILKANDIIHKHVKFHDKLATTKSYIRQNKETPEFKIIRGADAELKKEEIEIELIQKSKIIHTNTFTLAHEPARSAAIFAIEEASKKGKLVSFDPNYREKVWPDRKKAMEVLKKVYSFTDITKPSLDDAREIFGKRSPEEYIKRFHALGAKIVVLTMGSKGSMISCSNKEIEILPEQCKKIDATGAGDVYWATFLTSLLNKDTLENAGRKSSYAASKVVKTHGALLDDHDYADIQAYMELF